MAEFKITKGTTYPLGATITKDGVQFAAVLHKEGDCGVVLIDKKSGDKIRIPFTEGKRIGNISSVLVKGLDIASYDYNFYCNEEEYVDPHAKRIIGNEVWGIKEEEVSLRSGFGTVYENWEGDEPLCIPYEDSVIYCLHVRGFTVHPSSKVKGGGTFQGIIAKTDYLKSLGVTAIELMPAYEFEEYNPPQKEENSDGVLYFLKEKPVMPLNYWGYKEGYYFAPKASYAYGNDACSEFKDMVKHLHKNGIEVIMQFYFPEHVKQGFIFDSIRYWVTEYHIDGVHLKGSKVPISFMGTEPLFANTKIFYHYIPEQDIYGIHEIPPYKNMCIYTDDFMYHMRKFLKGDDDMLSGMLALTKRKPERVGSVNFITNYYGFTLNDLVSYDKKHNEENGENNHDGADYNYSWNCGVEGKSRKNAVSSLRKKMMRNALMLVMLSQGTPVLLAGDEFCNSQNGNNNPYCQDNEISWLNWNLTKPGKEMLEFTRALIAYRKNAAFLHAKKEFTMLDMYHCGYPDLSYHGEEAWRAELANYNHHVGIMYSNVETLEHAGEKTVIETGKKSGLKNADADAAKTKQNVKLWYVAYNMHWEKKQFSLPKLDKEKTWKVVMTTGETVKELEGATKSATFELAERSITVFEA